MTIHSASNGICVHPIPAKYLRIWDGVDREACRLMAVPLDAWLDAVGCSCEALCVCEETEA